MRLYRFGFISVCSFLSFVFVGSLNQVHAQNFDIQINFIDPVSADVESAFNDATTFWEDRILGYQTGIGFEPLVIDAEVVAIDGVGAILGGASVTDTRTSGGFTVSTEGYMQFDSDDVDALIAASEFDDVIKHELGHVIGVGSLWTANGVYVNGSGMYTGAAGLAQYNIEFDPAATFVPVELEYGPGTADGHWDEETDNIAIAGPFAGLSLNDELMTGFLSGSNFLSNTTLGSLEDIGFVTVLSGAVGDLNWIGRESVDPTVAGNWINNVLPVPVDGNTLGFGFDPNYSPEFGTFFTGIELGGITVGPQITVDIVLIDPFTFEAAATIANQGVGTVTFSGALAFADKFTLSTLNSNSIVIIDSAITSTDAVAGDTLTKTGDGILQLNSANTLPFGVALSDGTLQVGINGALGAAALNVTGDSTLSAIDGLTLADDVSIGAGFDLYLTSHGTATEENRSVNFSGGFTFGSTTSMVMINHTGMTILSGATSGSNGILDITNGTTRISGNWDDADLTLGANAHLQGAGGSVNDATIAGILNPGTGGTTNGIFNATGDVTISGTYKFNFDDVAGTGTPGTDYDRFNVTGDLTVTGTISPVFDSDGLPDVGDIYDVGSVGGTSVGVPTSIITPLVDFTVTEPGGLIRATVTDVRTFQDISDQQIAPYLDDVLTAGTTAADEFIGELLGDGSTTESVQFGMASVDSSLITASLAGFNSARSTSQHTLNIIQQRHHSAPRFQSAQENVTMFDQQMFKSFGERTSIRQASIQNLDYYEKSYNESGEVEYTSKTLFQPTLENFDWDYDGPKTYMFAELYSTYFREKRSAGQHLTTFDYGALVGFEVTNFALGEWADLTVGVGVGLGNANSDVDVSGTDVKDIYIRTISYGALTKGPWNFSLQLGSGYHWSESTRIDILSNGNGDYNSSEFFVSTMLDYAYVINQHWSLAPYGKVTFHTISRDAFTETGLNPMSYNSSSSDALFTEFGLSLIYDESFLGARLSLGVENEWMQDAGNITFSGLGATGTLTGVEAPQTSLRMSNEVDLQLTEWMEFFARYDLMASNDTSSHSVHLGARFLLQ